MTMNIPIQRADTHQSKACCSLVGIPLMTLLLYKSGHQ